MDGRDYIAARIAKSDADCWVWKQCKDADGYGVCRKMDGGTRAHRVSYTAFVGAIPEGMYVLHSCDNPPCCNPAHLFVGDAAANARDAMRKGRNSRGERNGASKLTAADVVEIRRRYAAGDRHADIAAAFGLNVGSISQLCGKKSRAWGHLPKTARDRHHLTTVTDQQRQLMRERRMAGATYRQIAEEFGSTYGAVKRWCLKNGLGGLADGRRM